MAILIEKLVSDGFGLGRDNGQVVFVPKSVPGDVLEIDTVGEKKGYLLAQIKRIIKPSSDRIKPPCEYFEYCGGCDHQNISYKKQLEIKEGIVKESLARQKVKAIVEKIIAGSDDEFYYRNSIRFTFLTKNNQVDIARHAYPSDKNLVAVDGCMLQSKISNEIAKTMVDCLNKNAKNFFGLWQLKIRQGKRTGEIMVEIITSSDDLPAEKVIVEQLSGIKEIKSIYHTIAPAKSLLNVRRRLIYGSPVIFEKIGAYTFQISVESFFQTNSLGAKTLYDKIKEFADIQISDKVLDLYCGTGSIGIYLSTLAKEVIGVEAVPEAVRDANDNARINKIKNCKFICSRVSQFLDSSVIQHDVIIIDPPRAGVDKKIITILSKSKFRNLIYASCNPATFARDLKLFEYEGIVAEKIQPIDMFPQTHHIEIVASLIKG